MALFTGWDAYVQITPRKCPHDYDVDKSLSSIYLNCFCWLLLLLCRPFTVLTIKAIISAFNSPFYCQYFMCLVDIIISLLSYQLHQHYFTKISQYESLFQSFFRLSLNKRLNTIILAFYSHQSTNIMGNEHGGKGANNVRHCCGEKIVFNAEIVDVTT